MSGHTVPRIAARTVPRPVAIAAAVCLVVPAVLNVAFHLLTPITSPALPTALGQAAAHPGQAAVAASLQFALPVLAVGVLVLGWRASAGSPRLAAWGAGFLGGGYLLGSMSAVDNLLQAIVPAHADPVTALRVVRGFESSLPGHLAALAIIGQGPGLLLLGSALWRSRAVPRGLAGCFLATLPLHAVTHSNDGNTLPALSWAWFTVVVTACAVVIVRDARGSEPQTPTQPWSTTVPTTTMSA